MCTTIYLHSADWMDGDSLFVLFICQEEEADVSYSFAANHYLTEQLASQTRQ